MPRVPQVRPENQSSVPRARLVASVPRVTRAQQANLALLVQLDRRVNLDQQARKVMLEARASRASQAQVDQPGLLELLAISVLQARQVRRALQALSDRQDHKEMLGQLALLVRLD